VGAAGNALLARAVAKAAKDYFASHVPTSGVPGVDPRTQVVEVDDADTELLDDDIVDAVIVETEVELVDSEIVDAEIVD
jgi:predicted ThiF/HesA family dinucleotide-utilizing enzyme